MLVDGSDPPLQRCGDISRAQVDACVLDKLDVSEYGKFGWVMDPEGNKVELWEPPPGQ